MKTSSYFPHDSNAKDDPKCILLIEQLGCEGYGIFWILVETLKDQPDFKYPVELLSALARRYNTSHEKMKTVVEKYNLFEIEENMFFYSKSLINRMGEIAEKRLKYSEAGKKGMLSRWKSNQKELPANNDVITTLLDCNNDIITSKVKKSKVKESIEYYQSEIESNSDSDFINQYKAFFDILMFNNPDNDKLESVLSIPKQVSYKSFCALLKKSQEKKKKFSALLPTMDNDTKYTKKKSLSLTLHTWLNRD